MHCQSCGGVIGRDCFNPQECAEITADMARQPECAVSYSVAALVAALEAVDDGRSLDEAFIWEPEIERRPLVTFGDLRRLAAAHSPNGASPTERLVRPRDEPPPSPKDK